jgi:uncharacterized protein YbbC (DUF1343 family)
MIRSGHHPSSWNAKTWIGRAACGEGSAAPVWLQYACVCARLAALPLGIVLGACGVEGSSRSTAGGPVLPGIDVLLRDGADAVAGKRLGLITNHTGLTADGRSTIDALHSLAGTRLVALFGPEHGLRGTAGAGERITDGRDARTGLPVRSLYGDTQKPTPTMLADVDVLVFDIQDIGTRYYTYVWTMALAMQAAAEQGKGFVVLDRPNPIGGALVQGNVLDTAFATFVGLYPVPMRHGMTAGEVATLVNREFDIGADLTVVRVEGWQRDQYYDDTGLSWLAPSPNMPSVESATHYPGTCLFEGTNLSVGRGTAMAYQQVGAPWLDAPAAADRLTARGLPGVRVEATSFSPENPGDGKFGGLTLPALRFHVTDRARYDPTITAVAALVEIQALHADSLRFVEDHFDRLAGTDGLRQGILAGRDVAELTAGWAAQLASFAILRGRSLLY